MTTRSYQQLQPEDRVTIAAMHSLRWSLRAIARSIGRSTSTVKREIERNSVDGHYGSSLAQTAADDRRGVRHRVGKLHCSGKLWIVVSTCLSWRWSPQQIAATLRRMWPDDPDMHVSHETIYTAIYAHASGELRRQLIGCLRQGQRVRKPRTTGTDRRFASGEMLSVHVRPPEVNDRLFPGHWEGDLIKGEGNHSAVGVLVERSTRLVLLAKMDDATANSALVGFTRKLNTIYRPLCQTLTYDQGSEMAMHAQLTKRTGVKVYFCDPHSPWQRGTCENTNGLLRQYMPKGTDLSVFSQAQLDDIADELNNRPRATHDWQSPLQVYAAILQSHDNARH